MNVIECYGNSCYCSYSRCCNNFISGDYRIQKGIIHFSDAPYGPIGIGTLTTRSSFSGRALFRLNYDNNFILDDISESFNGIGRTFNLTSYGSTVTGIQGINTSFGAVLINNIFQKPFYSDVGSVSRSDYRITGVGQTIIFTGAFVWSRKSSTYR